MSNDPQPQAAARPPRKPAKSGKMCPMAVVSPASTSAVGLSKATIITATGRTPLPTSSRKITIAQRRPSLR